MTTRNKKERLLKKKVSRTMKSVKQKMKKDGYEFTWHWYRVKFYDSLILKLIYGRYNYEIYNVTYTGRGREMKGNFHLAIRI